MRAIVVGICFALSGLAQTAPQRAVVVCLDRIGNTATAESIATQIYAGIGVELQWRHCRTCPAGGIRIGMKMNTPALMMQGALAYTTPYGDATIRVFYDRVLNGSGGNRAIAAALLGHVLAHEIGHVLQGISRHSDGGVMRAKWEFRDVLDMLRKPFSFDPIDEQLILNGMHVRLDRAERVVTQ